MKKIFLSLLAFVLLCIVSLIIIGGGLGDRSWSYIPQSHSPIVFAHRGVVEQYPENSLPAFQAALNLGYTSIETDIRQTKDGVLIVFHDASIERLLNGSENVQELTWKEIQSQLLWHKDSITPYHPISLEELFEFLPDTTLVYLDMKEYSSSIGKSLLDIIDRYNRWKHTLVANSNLAYLAHLRYYKPEVITVLEGFSPGKEYLYSIVPKSFKPDYFSSFWHAATEEQSIFLRKKQLMNRRIVYGVTPHNITSVYSLGISHIIYDHSTQSSDLNALKKQLDPFAE